MINHLTTWLKTRLGYYRTANMTLIKVYYRGRRFVYLAWGSDEVEGEIEEVE